MTADDTGAPAKRDTRCIAGIDSMVLIYAGAVPVVQKSKSSAFEELRVRAKLLLNGLSRDEADVVLPAVAITELLVPVPVARHGVVIAELAKHFICQPHDLRAATIAAQLWAQHKTLPQNLQYENRNVLKADALIVAAAKAAGATHFYSHDASCRALAGLIMKAFDLPKRGKDLFIEGEIRRGEV